MKVKLKDGKKLPRMISIPGMDKKRYRQLQAGGTVDVSAGIDKILIDDGFCVAVDIAEKQGEDFAKSFKKGAVKDGTDSTD